VVSHPVVSPALHSGGGELSSVAARLGRAREATDEVTHRRERLPMTAEVVERVDHAT